MKSIKKLNSKLQKIEEYEKQMKNFSKIEEIPYLQLIKYKNIMKQKQKITKEKYLVERFAKGSELLYKYNTNRWISDQNINCRKYCKLEARAKYERDLNLYKSGVIDERPISPRIQYLKNLKLFNNVFFKKVHNKLVNFKSNILPKKINQTAIGTAKLCIQGYRKIQSDCIYMRKYISTKKSVKYIKNIFYDANRQLLQANTIEKNNYADKEKSYRDSLRVQPQNYIEIYKNNQNDNKNITVKRKNVAVEYDI